MNFEDQEKTSQRVKEWRDEWLMVLNSQFADMAEKNASLEVDNRLMLSRIAACRKMEEKLRTMSEEELDVDGWYLSSGDVVKMRTEVVDFMKEMWNQVKVKMYDVVSKPYQLYAEEERKMEQWLLQQQIIDGQVQCAEQEAGEEDILMQDTAGHIE